VSGSVADLPRIGKEFASTQVKTEAPRRYDPRNRDAGKKRVIVAGLITEMRELITKKGTRMAFAKVEDLTGTCELVIFPDTFARIENLLKDERPLLIAGLLEVSEEGMAKIIVDSLSPLEEVLKKTKRMTFHLDRLQQDQYPILYSVLAGFPGPTHVDFKVTLLDLKQEVIMEAEGLSGVMLDNDLLENIHSHFGTTNFIEVK
jgi:DNA polymerase-3 subunit alpha